MNETTVSKTSEYFKKKGIVLPKISELRNPHTIDTNILDKLKNTKAKILSFMALILFMDSLKIV